MAMPTAITSVLTVYEFTVAARQNYLMNTEGLDRWDAFTMIDLKDFGYVAKAATCHTQPFTVGVVKIKALKTLKLWIEDTGRMDEVTRQGSFIRAVLNEYPHLYAVISAAEKDYVEFVVGLKLDPDDWDTFVDGIEECLSTIIGNGGVPLSYMISDNTLRPVLVQATATQSSKLYWNARFAGAYFFQDQVHVWGNLTQRIIGTPTWNIIKTFQSTMNAWQAWLDLQVFYGGPTESRKRMVVACAALKVLK